ncbi:MAG: hypothetical protein OEX76_06515 [Candidatus Bathyarchaeota archaeon]|nr:hypothetical protein [Candidatus Bathyarchaeota archaeon]
MGLFKKLKAPKAKIELKLDEVAYEATDKFTAELCWIPKKSQRRSSEYI